MVAIKHSEWCVIISNFVNIICARFMRANYIEVWIILSCKTLIMISLMRIRFFYRRLLVSILTIIGIIWCLFNMRSSIFTIGAIFWQLLALILLTEDSLLDLVSHIISIVCMLITDRGLNFKISLARVLALKIEEISFWSTGNYLFLQNYTYNQRSYSTMDYFKYQLLTLINSV